MLLNQEDFVSRILSDGLGAVENNIVLGDCLEVLPYLPDNCVDLIHTSPPYNIDRQYKGSRNDLSPLEEYEEFLEAVISECKRVVKPNGSIFWQTGYTQRKTGESGSILPIDILSYKFFCDGDSSFLLWDRIIWRYFGGMAFKRKFTNRHETIMWYVKPDAEQTGPYFDVDSVREKLREYDKRNNFWGRNPGNVWEVDRVAFGATEQSSHISVFPEEISEKIMRACTSEGALILDPFSGSGTAPKVARSLGRHWIGIEISEEYAREAVKRLGYQQSSEPCSLISGVIKFEIFGGRRTLTLPEIVSGISDWANSINMVEIRNEFDALIDAALSDESKSKSDKRRVWITLDERVARSNSSDPVVLADRYLLRDYKNRRNLNGATRIGTAIRTLEQALQMVQVESLNLHSLIARILDEEPSTYLVDGERISLAGLEKKIKLSVEDTLVHPLFSYVNDRGSHDEEGSCIDSISANPVPLKPGTNQISTNSVRDRDGLKT